jgi:hypothetical protein
LDVIYQGEFDENLINSTKCKEFYETPEEGERITYYANSAPEDGFSCSIRKISKGKTDSRGSVYWDFYKPSEGFSPEILLFVEMDSTDGFITITKGSEISPNDISVFNQS